MQQTEKAHNKEEQRQLDERMSDVAAKLQSLLDEAKLNNINDLNAEKRNEEQNNKNQELLEILSGFQEVLSQNIDAACRQEPATDADPSKHATNSENAAQTVEAAQEDAQASKKIVKENEKKLDSLEKVLQGLDETTDQADIALSIGTKHNDALDAVWIEKDWETLDEKERREEQEAYAQVMLTELEKKMEDEARETLKTPSALADRYEFEETIGVGSQACVYKAKRLSDDAPVAIKELRIDSVQNWKEYELFMREAKVLESIDTKGVARFYEAVECLEGSKPCAYIVQEYISGRSLDDLVKSGYRLSMQHIFKLAIDLINILEQLHTHEPTVIHRDIKPSNIMLKPTENGDFEAYLIDFGAVANPMIQGGGSTVAGTYGYMPPEQLMGKPCPASDTYSLAATLAYLLSGVEPADMHIQDFRLIIDPHMTQVPPNVTRVLNQMLEPDITKRLCNYNDLRKIFCGFLDGDFGTIESRQISPQEMEDRLYGTFNLGQNGNMDIWYGLNDVVPRPLPKVYETEQANYRLCTHSINQRVKKSWRKELKNLMRKKNSQAIFFHIIMYLLFFIGLIMIIVNIVGIFKGIYIEAHYHTLNALSGNHYTNSVLNSNSHLIVIQFISCLAGALMIFAGVGASSFLTSMGERFYNKNFLKYTPPKDKDRNVNKGIVEDIIKYGEKCIATVIQIKYIPAPENSMEKYYLFDQKSTTYSLLALLDNKDTSTGERIPSIYCHAIPKFVIRYSFRTVSASCDKEIVHEIVVHTDPETTLSIGSPIPILYYLSPYDKNSVYSMPFPYPIYDMVSYEDMYCCTELKYHGKSNVKEDLGGWV